MRGYSLDLRERIIKAWESGKRQAWIVETFGVSAGSVKRYIRRYQSTGQVAATVQKRQVPRIGMAQHEALRALVARLPEAQLVEYCAVWQTDSGITVSPQTMSRVLVSLGLRRKKRPLGRVNGTK